MTLIDKAEALRLAREVWCGNCGSWIDPENPFPECCERPDWRDGRDAQQLARAIAALPARGVGVKQLQWKQAGGDIKAGDGFSAWPDLLGAPITIYRKHDGWWLSSDCKTHPTLDAAKAAAQADYEARILAALAPDAALVRVKPLAWEPSAINKPWHSAKAPWGWYYAQWDDETQAWFASLEMGEVEAPIIMSPSDLPTIEAAKAAAQADYEARILAALELPTSLQKVQRTLAPTDAAQAREAALLSDAANVIRDLMAAYSKPDERLCCNGHECGCQGATVQMQAEYYANEFLALIGERT